MTVLSKVVLRLLRSFTKRLLNGFDLKISRHFYILLEIFLNKDKRHNLEFGYKATTLPTDNRKIKRSTLGYDFPNSFSRIKIFKKIFGSKLIKKLGITVYHWACRRSVQHGREEECDLQLNQYIQKIKYDKAQTQFWQTYRKTNNLFSNHDGTNVTLFWV